MGKNYDVWWQKGDESDDDMARDHVEAWVRTIQQIDSDDIEHKVVLDFGCNQGGFLRTMYEMVPFKEGVGIDLAEKSLAKAQEMKGTLPLTYFLTDTPKDTEKSYDTVFSTSVLYLIEDIAQHAKDIKEVLHPGGCYYATFADLTHNPSREYMEKIINQYGATPSQNHSLKHIVDCFVKEGFEVSVKKETVPDTIDLTHYDNFYLSPNDYLQTLFNESFLIKATLKEGNLS
ncbi:class I SAM-dependent methyltransferase [Staphylococcus felis]|uniref:class I SAM-dependent methyltransferase n=1 Tax=Staphylococcus felis TaxID=46127 RepID=UPI0021D28B6F|nr:class I SAM-dependent methyltransferase [Staphylococcus felis]UXR86836.1 class I SAM-dependent methyltransferase [Staphylococcus felis]